MPRVDSSGALSRIRSSYDGNYGEWEDTDAVMRAGRGRRTGMSMMATHTRSECIRRYGPYIQLYRRIRWSSLVFGGLLSLKLSVGAVNRLESDLITPRSDHYILIKR